MQARPDWRGPSWGEYWNHSTGTPFYSSCTAVPLEEWTCERQTAHSGTCRTGVVCARAWGNDASRARVPGAPDDRFCGISR